MSSKYQKPFVIPEGFPALLKGFTREVLRTQPDNIYEFGAQYFQQLLGQPSKDAASASAPGSRAGRPITPETVQLDTMKEAAVALDLSSLSPTELEQMLLRLFIQADIDGSGYLDRQEFSAVLRAGGLNLTERQIREVLAEADENDDSVIQYQEFMPVMVDVLQSIKAQEQAHQQVSAIEETARNDVAGLLLHGMPAGELEQLMLNVFRKADTDGSGQLSRQEFKQCLRAAEIGLTRKDINLLLSQVDANQDGMISYQEFIPVCFQVLVERFKDEVVGQDVLSNQQGLQGMLLEQFQGSDPEGTGVLPVQALKALLRDLSYQVLGLTTVQLVALISQAEVDDEGCVNYVAFVPLAAAMIKSMYDVKSMKQRIQAITQVTAAGGIRALSQLNLDELRSVLGGAFRTVDQEGAGQLSEPQVMQVLETLGTDGSLLLTEAHRRAMFAAIDVDESGTVDWPELVNFICDAIEHLEREAYIQSQVAAN